MIGYVLFHMIGRERYQRRKDKNMGVVNENSRFCLDVHKDCLSFPRIYDRIDVNRISDCNVYDLELKKGADTNNALKFLLENIASSKTFDTNLHPAILVRVKGIGTYYIPVNTQETDFGCYRLSDTLPAKY